MKIGRNDPCPCGSGKKYKFCCETKKAEGKGDWSRYALYAIAISIGLGIGGFFIALADAPDDGRVWSAEHGHWHNADGTEIVTGNTAQPGGPPYPQPPGPVPEGKVWSPDHGHWHDAVTGVATD